MREMDINQSTAVLENTLAASGDAQAEPASCSLVLGKIIIFAMPGVSASVEQRLLKYLSLGIVLRMKQTNTLKAQKVSGSCGLSGSLAAFSQYHIKYLAL